MTEIDPKPATLQAGLFVTSVVSLPALLSMPPDNDLSAEQPQGPRKRGRRARSRNLAFALNLKRLRGRDGFKRQQDLDDALEVPRGTVSAWERRLREPTLDELAAVAAIFKVTTDKLLDQAATFTEQPSNVHGVDEVTSDAAWQRLVRDLFAHYPGRIEIKEINLWAPNQIANVNPTMRRDS